MPIAIFNTKSQMSQCLKEMTKTTLSRHAAPRILFPTGTTPLGPEGFFQALIDAKHHEQLDTSRIRLVSGDEYHGIALDDPGSFATYLRTKVMEPLGMDTALAHVLNGQASDVALHCQEFEASLHQDPCTLAVLGLGTNGHVAFNDPPSSIHSTTRCLSLTQGSIASSKNDFPEKNEEDLPTRALSVGLDTLTSHCRACCVLVTGQRKAGIVKQVLDNEEYQGDNVPASLLRTSKNVVFCLDKEAASLLPPSAIATSLQCQTLSSTEAAGLLFAATSTVIVNGDVGGTNARMQLWDVYGSGVTVLRKDKRYVSNDFASGQQLLHTFLNDTGVLHHPTETIEAVALAMCGPVTNEQHQSGPVLVEQGATGWGFDIATVCNTTTTTGLVFPTIYKAKLLNDFVAVGLGISALPSTEIVTLHACDNGADPLGTKAAVGAGTGLGAVFMTYDSSLKAYVAHPSEGGMGEFAAQSEDQWALRNFIKKKLGGYCTVESVVSGPGLVNCYDFVQSRCGGGGGSGGSSNNILKGVDRKNAPARIILGVSEKDTTCVKALNLFVQCLACHLRLTALQLLPTGGLYICGGIPCRDIVIDVIKQMLSPGLFVDDMVMGEFIQQQISLHVVLNSDCGLLGAKVRALRLLNE